MRRFALPVLAVLGVISLPLTSASADPSQAVIPVPAAKPGQAVCKVDKELHSLTGLTATASGYAAVDKSDDNLNTRVFVLSSSCQRSKSLPYTGGGSSVQDPRDIEVSPDGKDYYVADTGDDLQSPQRSSIALWKIPADQSQGTRYAFTYPDGDGPYVSDAFLMGSDGSPVFVTHPLSGPAGIYVPTSAPSASQTVPLKKAGTFQPENTGTANKLGGLVAALTVTGGAVSPDGKKVVLRTYSDAYEWDVAGGATSANITKALTSGTPRITPLPNEDQAEAITYSHDGKYFLTISDLPTGNQTTMLRYTPDAAIPVKHVAAAGMGSGSGSGGGFISGLSYTKVKVFVVVVGVIGLAMLASGVIGITRARRRQPALEPAEGAEAAGQWGQPEMAMSSPGRAPARAGVRPRRDPERSGSVYPSGRGSQPPDAGYLNTRDGRPEPPGGPRGRSAPPPAGGTYRSGGEGGTYRSGGRDEGAVRGGRDRGRPDRGVPDRGAPARGGPDRGGPDRGGSGGGTYSGGTYSGGTYSSGAYQPPATPPVPPPRTGDGIARSHRPERRGTRGSAQPPRRGGGYAEEHDGFDDLRRLGE